MLITRLTFFILLILPLTLANIQINEIMYAPIDGNEWVEIYNPTNDTINLSNWFLSDNQNTDTLECCSFVNNCRLSLPSLSYMIITDQDTTIYNSTLANISDNQKICVDDNALGNGLSNAGDVIKLHHQNYTTIVNFTDNLANKNGLSLEFDLVWRESYIMGGTPGFKNSIDELILSNFSDNQSNNQSDTLTDYLIDNNSLNSTNYSLNQTSNQTSDPSFNQINSRKKYTLPEIKMEIYPSTISVNYPIFVNVTIKNSNGMHSFSIWSYIYRGSKCYSCAAFREENLQTISLSEDEEKVINFSLNLMNTTKPGDYNLKVKILKDQQITPKELIEKITVIEKTNVVLIYGTNSSKKLFESSNDSLIDSSENKNNNIYENQGEFFIENISEDMVSKSKNKLTGTVIFQSKHKKIQGLIPYFFVLAIAFLIIVFVWDR